MPFSFNKLTVLAVSFVWGGLAKFQDMDFETIHTIMPWLDEVLADWLAQVFGPDIGPVTQEPGLDGSPSFAHIVHPVADGAL